MQRELFYGKTLKVLWENLQTWNLGYLSPKRSERILTCWPFAALYLSLYSSNAAFQSSRGYHICSSTEEFVDVCFAYLYV